MQASETILLADDNSNDLLLMDVAFQKAGLEKQVHVVRDGKEVQDYLQGAGRFQDRDRYPLPSLVLLDLRLPRVDGLEVLRWIRENIHFQDLPVIMLTGAREERQQVKAYALGASECFPKPLIFGDLVSLVSDQLRSILASLREHPCPQAN